MKRLFVCLFFGLGSLSTMADDTQNGASIGAGAGCVPIGSPFRSAAKENGYAVTFNALPENLQDVSFCDDGFDISGKDMIDVIRQLAQRYPECFSVHIDDQKKTMEVAAKEGMLHIISTHRAQNEYFVDGRLLYSFPSDETKDRFICPHSAKVTPDWAKNVQKALAR